MSDNSQLRIFVSEKYFPIFQKIARGGIFTQNSEFFVFCAFVGKKIEKNSPLEKKYELCQVSSLTEYDHTALKTLFLKEHDELPNQEEMIALAEEYANSGIAVMVQTSMIDLVYQDSDGNWHFKPDVSINQLQMELFDYVLQETAEVPF